MQNENIYSEPGPVLLKKRDLAVTLNVSSRTVDNLLRAGLPHLRLANRTLRFEPAECVNWLREKYRTQRRGNALTLANERSK